MQVWFRLKVHCSMTFTIEIFIALATRKSEFRFLDFLELFRHFFGRILFNFLQLFGRFFAKKILETLVFVIFSADNLHLADFQHFFGRVSANIWKGRSIWQTFGIWFLFFFWILRQILEKNLTKISQKSAKKARNRNSDLRIANASCTGYT